MTFTLIRNGGLEKIVRALRANLSWASRRRILHPFGLEWRWLRLRFRG